MIHQPPVLLWVRVLKTATVRNTCKLALKKWRLFKAIYSTIENATKINEPDKIDMIRSKIPLVQ